MCIHTSIVNIRHHKSDIYCGRPSIFSNPYIHGRDGTRDDVCDKYAELFKHKITNPQFYKELLTLQGKSLGCWCRCIPQCNNPKCKSQRCHLETIVEYLNNL